MKRRVLFIFGLGILVVGGILLYGSVEKADSSSCLRRLDGYVYCDNNDPCAGASVFIEDINYSQNQHLEYTDSNGYFDFGYIKCASYDAQVQCGALGEGYLHCYYIDLDDTGCSKESLCDEINEVVLVGCEVSFHTDQTTCPTSK